MMGDGDDSYSGSPGICHPLSLHLSLLWHTFSNQTQVERVLQKNVPILGLGTRKAPLIPYHTLGSKQHINHPSGTALSPSAPFIFFLVHCVPSVPRSLLLVKVSLLHLNGPSILIPGGPILIHALCLTVCITRVSEFCAYLASVCGWGRPSLSFGVTKEDGTACMHLRDVQPPRRSKELHSRVKVTVLLCYLSSRLHVSQPVQQISTSLLFLLKRERAQGPRSAQKRGCIEERRVLERCKWQDYQPGERLNTFR